MFDEGNEDDEGYDEGEDDEGYGELDEGEDDEGYGELDEGEDDEGRPRRRRGARMRPPRGRRRKRPSGAKNAVLNAVANAESEFTLQEASRPNQLRGVAAKVPGQPIGFIPGSTAYVTTVTVSTSGIFLRQFLIGTLPAGVLITKLVINDIELVKGDGVAGASLAAVLNANQQVIAAAGRKFNGTYTITVEWSNYNPAAQWVPPLEIGEQNTVCKRDTETSPVQGFVSQNRIMNMIRAAGTPRPALRI